jgi:hypothetical protein
MGHYLLHFLQLQTHLRAMRWVCDKAHAMEIEAGAAHERPVQLRPFARHM